MAEGKTVVTENGLRALIEASSVGKQIKPAYFKVSEQDIGDIYPGINIADLPAVWYQAPISAYIPVNDSTVQFILDIPQDKATKYGKTFGLYLEDGTLFAVAKPPFSFPPLMRQRFRVQFVWEQIESVMNFQEIPFYEFDQDVVHLDAVSTISLALFDVQEHLTVLEQFKVDYYRFKSLTSERLKNHEERISTNEMKIQNHELAILDAIPTLELNLLSVQRYLTILDQFKADYYRFKLSLSEKINEITRVTNEFTQELSFNGYQKFPGGLLLQWGAIAVQDGESVGTFPISL